MIKRLKNNENNISRFLLFSIIVWNEKIIIG